LALSEGGRLKLKTRNSKRWDLENGEVGAGASKYTFQGVRDGMLRFEGFTWFYDILPATRSVLEVRPYDPVKTEKNGKE
jgi:hypothetical protein